LPICSNSAAGSISRAPGWLCAMTCPEGPTTRERISVYHPVAAFMSSTRMSGVTAKNASTSAGLLVASRARSSAGRSGALRARAMAMSGAVETARGAQAASAVPTAAQQAPARAVVRPRCTVPRGALDDAAVAPAELFAVGQRNRDVLAALLVVAQRVDDYRDLVAGLEQRRAPTFPCEVARGIHLDAPVRDIAVGIDDVHVDPRMRVAPAELRDSSGQRDLPRAVEDDRRVMRE